MNNGTVNDQVVDSVNSVTALISGQTPAHAFAMLDTVMVETLGMAMYNAVNRQQNAGMVNSAAVTAACARMLNAYAELPVAPPPPAPPPAALPSVHPLPGPTPAPSDQMQVQSAALDGSSAITTLQQVAERTSALAGAATTQLQSLETQASTALAGVADDTHGKPAKEQPGDASKPD